MITWAGLFEADGSPLSISYKDLRPAISTRTAGALDQAKHEPWFRSDSAWAKADGSDFAEPLLEIPGCGLFVIAELDALRSGGLDHHKASALKRRVDIRLTRSEVARVDAYRSETSACEHRAETLRRLVLEALEAHEERRAGK